MRSSAMVSTSPSFTACPGEVSRTPLTRTWPFSTSCGGAGAGFHDPRMPQKLVEALAIQAFSFDAFSSREPCPLRLKTRSRYSLRLPASCSFSAASLAKGELGSAARSRSRGFDELA